MRSILVDKRSEIDRPPIGLTLLSGAIAAILVLPLTWLVLQALSVDPGRVRSILLRAETLDIAVNSLLLMVIVTASSILIGVPLAYLTVRTDLPFRGLWSVLVALPLVIPSYVGAFAFVSAFGPRGAFHSILAPLGVDRLPEIYGLPGAALVITLYTYPYVYLTTRAALLSLDPSLVDAARTLNQGRWRTVRRVTMPLVRPAITAGALLTALYAISDFGTPAIMRLPVFTRQIYVEYNSFGQDYAALLSLQLLVVVVIILALESRIRSDGGSLRGAVSSRSSEAVVRLGRWRWPAMALPAIVVGLALIVPIWILGLWAFTADVGTRPSLAFRWEYAVNSVFVAGIAAFVACAAAIPIAYSAAQYDSRLAVVFERMTYVGYAVPGIVLALALVYFGAGYVPIVYQTLPLLVFAYVVRFMPQAVGTIRSNTQQVDRTLIEVSRSLGLPPLRTFSRVTLPLIAPGMSAGAALVFLTTMKELPATLVLRPTGFETIVTQIWRAQEAAYFQYAAVPALLLLLVSGLSMIVLLSLER